MINHYTSHVPHLVTKFISGTDLNEFAFTPVYNNSDITTVTVTMPTNRDSSGNVASTAQFGGSTVAAGQSITVQLRYGQTAQFQGISADQDLNGAHIVSDRPISAFSGMFYFTIAFRK